MHPNEEYDRLDNSERIKTLVLSGEHQTIPLDLFDVADKQFLEDYTIECWHWSYMYISSTKANDPQYTHARLQICRFVLNEKWDITDCDNFYDQNLLIYFLSIVKNSPFFEWYIAKNYWDKLWDSCSALENVKLRYKEIMDQAQWEKEKEVKVRDRALFFWSNFKKRGLLDVSNNAEVLSVWQSEIWKIDSTTSKRYIETLWAGPCIILIWYNASLQTVVLSHIDSSCDPQDTLSLMRSVLWSQTETKFHVLWWDNSSIKDLVEVNEWLERNSIHPATFDVLNTTKSVIVDRLTGEIYDAIWYNRRPDVDPTLEKMMIENRVFEAILTWKRLLPEWSY